MSSDFDDPLFLWYELVTDALRQRPRLHPGYGHCGSCWLTATHAQNWGGVLWSACSTCMTRWRPDDPDVELNRLSNSDAEAFVKFLAECQELPALPSPDNVRYDSMEDNTFMKSTKLDSVPSFGDPRRFQKFPKEIPLLPGTTPAQRVRVVDFVMEDLRTHPLRVEYTPSGKPITKWKLSRMWDRIRAFPVDERHNVERALSSPEAVSPVDSLETLVGFLLEMRARRQALLDELRSLDIIADCLGETEAATVA